MNISREWLQLYFETPLPGAGIISDALTFHAFEVDGVEPVREKTPIEGLGKAIDYVFDVKVTPNRGHDALSHRGIAKELTGILNLPLINDPMQDAPNLIPKTVAVSVTVTDSNLCPRYIACLIEDIVVGPSPEWLKARLEAIGQRSINNVVDATNFVMFNIGQPLHAFDVANLQSEGSVYAIEVRPARKGETIISLDEKEYTLTESMLIIVDGVSDAPIGIAGVKGGKASGVNAHTTSIIIESANFHGVSVRTTAKALNLITDASQRFQQVLSPELAAYGMRSVVDLIREIAGGKVVGFTDVYPNPTVPWQVTFNATQTARLLGYEISLDEIRGTLTRLDHSFDEVSEGVFTVTPPIERIDLIIPEDIIEEIGRLIGYEKIKSMELSVFEKTPAPNRSFATQEAIRERLVQEGYSEVYTSVFTDKGEVAVLNKVDSVRPFLRSNMTDALKEAYAKNLSNKDLLGLKEIKLFEIGSVWKGAEECINVATIDSKKSEEKRISEFMSEVTALSYEELPISSTERYRIFSRYPSITRDIALFVPNDTSPEEVSNIIAQSAGKLMVRLDLFDEFKKGEKTSFAFRLVFQSSEKTLTDDEANAAMDLVYQAAQVARWEVR